MMHIMYNSLYCAPKILFQMNSSIDSFQFDILSIEVMNFWVAKLCISDIALGQHLLGNTHQSDERCRKQYENLAGNQI